MASDLIHNNQQQCDIHLDPACGERWHSHPSKWNRESEKKRYSPLILHLWHPDTTEQHDEMHYGPNKHNMKRNVRFSERSFKLLMTRPLVFDISNQLQIVSRWFNLIWCCSGAILGCAALIKELCRVRHRGGLLSLLQPNQSGSAEALSEHRPFLFSWYLRISSVHVCIHKQQKVLLLFWHGLFINVQQGVVDGSQ